MSWLQKTVLGNNNSILKIQSLKLFVNSEKKSLKYITIILLVQEYVKQRH